MKGGLHKNIFFQQIYLQVNIYLKYTTAKNSLKSGKKVDVSKNFWMFRKISAQKHQFFPNEREV